MSLKIGKPFLKIVNVFTLKRVFFFDFTLGDIFENDGSTLCVFRHKLVIRIWRDLDAQCILMIFQRNERFCGI